MDKIYASISNNPISFFNEPTKNVYSWLEAKRKDDNAEGLWRIHNNLYDLTDFIDRHPGGPDWLNFTKGTDITEAFEVHHLNEEKPIPFLKKFFVREAKMHRNCKLTFEPDGFYKILKKRIAEKYSIISKTPELLSKIYSDLLMLGAFLLSVLAIQFKSTALAILSGLVLALTIVIAHNFIHRRDNFRMFYLNLSMFSYREWRISHALSHHLFPNSLQDLEIFFFDPLTSWLPDPKLKGFVKRYGSWIYSPVLWATVYVNAFANRLTGIFLQKFKIYKDDFIPFTMPLVMFIFGNGNIIEVLYNWLIIIVTSSFYFAFVGVHGGHHHPEIVHEGDAIRKNLDWGLYTMDTVVDQQDLKGSAFLCLTHFGHHVLHHLFPTLDHGILHHFYPELFQTLAEHEGDLRDFHFYEMISGQFKQLARIEPMTDSPLARDKLKSKID